MWQEHEIRNRRNKSYKVRERKRWKNGEILGGGSEKGIKETEKQPIIRVDEKFKRKRERNSEKGKVWLYYNVNRLKDRFSSW